jgi:hypothetical protein
MTRNLFVDNRMKNNPDPWTGRMSHQTAKPAAFPELYFTLHKPHGTHGVVLVAGPSLKGSNVDHNPGAEPLSRPVDFNHGRQ